MHKGMEIIHVRTTSGHLLVEWHASIFWYLLWLTPQIILFCTLEFKDISGTSWVIPGPGAYHPCQDILRPTEPIYHLPLYALIFPRQTFLSPLSCLEQQQPRNFNQTNLHKNFSLASASFLCFTKLIKKSFSSERRIKRNTYKHSII